VGSKASAELSLKVLTSAPVSLSKLSVGVCLKETDEFWIIAPRRTYTYKWEDGENDSARVG